jgi:succinylglutamate desuccinylase
MNEQLTILNYLPDGFFSIEAKDIRRVFPTPTLIQLTGNKSPALFVSILLHGNEVTGLKALQSVLSRYQENLPRALILFIGNVAAAEKNCRYLSGQFDYNRCWPGTEMQPNKVTRLMREVFDLVTKETLFAAIDVHNNTGTNPHYAGMTNVTRENQHLAAMFNHIGMVFKHPKGVSTMAFNNICPALTLECGKPGDEAGILHAADYIDSLLHMDHLPQREIAAHDLQLVKSLATLNIPDDVTFDFNLSAQADLTFDSGFERKNFTEIKTTDVFAHTRVSRPLAITNQDGEDVTRDIMRIENGKIYLNKTLMPAMITLDKTIIRQDCLCYLLVDYHA